MAALIVSAVACGHPPQRPNPVGLTFAAYEDEARRDWAGTQNRPMATVIWYPTTIGTREARWHASVFDAGWNAQGAPLAAGTRKLPLVVLSHGTGGGAATMSWPAETLASNGYVVAAVNHHGNTAAEPAYQIQGFMLWWERAKDMSSHSAMLASGRHLPSPRARAGHDEDQPGGHSGSGADRRRFEGRPGFAGRQRTADRGDDPERRARSDPRDAVHRKVGADALAFFNRTLGARVLRLPCAPAQA